MALYPDELMELLNAFLTDGEISDRERAALLKRAEKCGVDPEEFDLFIDSKVQEVEMSQISSSEDDDNDDDDDNSRIAYHPLSAEMLEYIKSMSSDDDDDDDDDDDYDDDYDDDDDDDEEDEDDKGLLSEFKEIGSDLKETFSFGLISSKKKNNGKKKKGGLFGKFF